MLLADAGLRRASEQYYLQGGAGDEVYFSGFSDSD
jgi:hypothetical protein